MSCNWLKLNISFRYGGMGNLHTLPKFRRQGHAKRAVYALAKLHLSMGLVPSAYVEDYNEASRALFKSMKFQREFSAAWIGFNPKDAKSKVEKTCCV